MKLILSIRSFNTGGAERQFIELVKNIKKNIFDVYIVSMYGGILEQEIKNISNIMYYNFEKKGRYDLKFFFKYRKFLHKIKPKVIYSFLGEMNLFSYWCKPKDTKIIWGFRASNMDLKKYGKMSQLLFWLQKKYSKKIDKIIANSYASIEFHKKCGFDMSRAVVIHNGIDIDRFKRDENKRRYFREKFNLKENDIALGVVARIDEMKGYPVFSQSAKLILDEYKNVKFFAAGDGDERIKRECERILGEHNNKRFIWLGRVDKPEIIYNGLDIYLSSSSFGEGFSNSIAEAMACEVPCVVTDVGDSRFIVGDSGIVVKPNDANRLYYGIKKMIKLDFKNLGKIARSRIEKNFSVEKMVERTERIILEVLNK